MGPIGSLWTSHWYPPILQAIHPSSARLLRLPASSLPSSGPPSRRPCPHSLPSWPRKRKNSWWNHQEFQVPQIELLNLIRLFWGWVFPYISRIHTAYIGEDSSILGTWNVWWWNGCPWIWQFPIAHSNPLMVNLPSFIWCFNGKLVGINTKNRCYDWICLRWFFIFLLW